MLLHLGNVTILFTTHTHTYHAQACTANYKTNTMVELETQTLPLTRAATRAEGARGKTFMFGVFTRVKEFAYTNLLP